MKKQNFQALCLSLGVMSITQIGHSAALNTTKAASTTAVPMSVDKPMSPIEKALSQQKRERVENKLEENVHIKLLNTITLAPTQTFFAEQHQRFSRFVQAIFPAHNS